MRLFGIFPPVAFIRGAGANNNMLRIRLGLAHRNRAAVLVQELREFWMAWAMHFGPMWAGLLFAAVGFAHFGEIALLGLAGLLFALAAKIPAVARFRGVRGQVTEAVASVWLYGRRLEDELLIAARQLGAGDYRSKYGLEGRTERELYLMCAALVPSCTRYMRRHRAAIAREFARVEGRVAPAMPLSADFQALV
jgi:hypothetical protein